MDADLRQSRSGEETKFLGELGQRVRRMRAVRGMSRKVLARVSGISERYIAQLESGKGNVSITLLRRVAAAIGVPIEDLISEADGAAADWPAIRELLRSASGAQVAQARAILAGSSPNLTSAASGSDNRVALIGLRGAGKSTLGRIVAARLAWPFVELNAEIERDNGLSVQEIFAIYGQEGYRKFEQSAIREIGGRPGPMILATGGGVVAESLTFDMLMSSFFTVWLKTTPEEHMARVRKQGDFRPMADDRGAMHELRTILASREPLYARARAKVDTSNLTVEQAAERLLDVIEAALPIRAPELSAR